MCVCAMVGAGRHRGSQLRWLGSEHSIMEAEQRDLIEAFKSWKRFLWSKAVTVGDPALSNQTGFYWTGAESAATKQRGDREIGSSPAMCVDMRPVQVRQVCVSAVRVWVCICVDMQVVWGYAHVLANP